MAIIYNYPLNSILLAEDMLIGTSTNIVNGQPKNATKNFSIADLTGFIKQNVSLNDVLLVGNTSLLDAKVGGLYLYDTPVADYGNIVLNQNRFSFNTVTHGEVFRAQRDMFSSFSASGYRGSFEVSSITANRVWDLPNKSGTVALLSDVPVGTTPTLQEVLDEGHDLVSNNNFQGTGAGLNNTGNDVNAFGPSAAEENTGSYINAFGFIAGAGNIGINNNFLGGLSGNSNQGNNVNAFGYLAGSGNSFSNVNLFGENAQADENGQTVLSKDDTTMARISTANLTVTRKYNLPDASGGVALTSDIGTWGALNYPVWATGTPFVKMTATGTFALDTNTYLTSITSSDVTTALGYTPVTNARTLTINGVGYDLTADRSWTIATGTGTVTSVGMTVPSAFSVTPSSITTSGTFAITGAGLVSQYVRGDGTLANFPASTGGGASLSYYLNGSVSQGTIGGVAYKEINGVPVIGAGTDFTINADGYIAQFITDAGDPNKLLIPAGNWNFETYFSASSGGGSPKFYIELYKYNGTTFTLIASNSATPENITGGTSIDLYFTALAVPSTVLLATDRLAVRFYVIHSGRTITMHTENRHLSQIITTFTTGLTALNGLTQQVQNLAVGTSGTDFAISSATDTHTFNLPTASATNRGALSSADWTTFNNKQTDLGFTPENVANKQTDLTASATKYPTVNAVNTGLALKQNALSYTPYRFTAPAQIVHTGVLTETILQTILIPANTFSNGDFIMFSALVSKLANIGNTTHNLKINTTNSLVGATSITLLGFNTVNFSMKFKREMIVNGGNIYVLNVSAGTTNDQTNNGTASLINSYTYNLAADMYFFVTCTLGNILDTITYRGINFYKQ